MTQSDSTAVSGSSDGIPSWAAVNPCRSTAAARSRSAAPKENGVGDSLLDTSEVLPTEELASVIGVRTSCLRSKIGSDRTYSQLVDTTTTLPGTTTSTLIGPNGTAPGLNFIEQQQKPLRDSSGERAAALPLLVAGIVLLVVFSVVFIRSWRRKQRRSPSVSATEQ